MSDDVWSRVWSGVRSLVLVEVGVVVARLGASRNSVSRGMSCCEDIDDKSGIDSTTRLPDPGRGGTDRPYRAHNRLRHRPRVRDHSRRERSARREIRQTVACPALSARGLAWWPNHVAHCRSRHTRRVTGRVDHVCNVSHARYPSRCPAKRSRHSAVLCVTTMTERHFFRTSDFSLTDECTAMRLNRGVW